MIERNRERERGEKGVSVLNYLMSIEEIGQCMERETANLNEREEERN